MSKNCATQRPRGKLVATAAIIAVSAVAPPLTRREQAPLERGPISGTRHVAGAAISVMPGLGLGHIVQGRWKERGWIFTLGELVAFGFIAVAASESDLDTNVVGALAITGWGGLIGLRVWEVQAVGSRRIAILCRAVVGDGGHADGNDRGDHPAL